MELVENFVSICNLLNSLPALKLLNIIETVHIMLKMY